MCGVVWFGILVPKFSVEGIALIVRDAEFEIHGVGLWVEDLGCWTTV